MQISDLKTVKTMIERKSLMADLADGFVALPGGYGTLSEICDVIVALQLGHSQKPCALLNVNGFYEPLLMQIRKAVEEGFIPAKQRDLLLVESDPQQLADAFAIRLRDNDNFSSSKL